MFGCSKGIASSPSHPPKSVLINTSLQRGGAERRKSGKTAAEDYMNISLELSRVSTACGIGSIHSQSA
jgi:hypothetical protein